MLHRVPKHRNGFALVLVLSFIALLLVVALAFFSKSILQRKISSSSFYMSKTDLFAQGALGTTVGDLRQEIVDGSTSTSISAGTQTVSVYSPTSPSGYTGLYPTMVPYRVASGTTSTLPNLVKESLSGQAFYSGSLYAAGGPSRAANSVTTTPSLNLHSVSLARWNEPLLLPRLNSGASSTDLTPVAAFTAPNWIYVDTSGQNPTTFPAANAAKIVGRYAYCIYNEGGLLDMNVAGYPVETDAATASRKIGASFADLTALQNSTGTPYFTQSQIDSIVGWRNYASGQPTGSFPGFSFSSVFPTAYFTSIVSNATGFMTAGNSTLQNNQSDQRFASRQQLIDFLSQLSVSNPNTTNPSSSLLDALQYLGTYSRSLDQPSIWPDPTTGTNGRPTVAGYAAEPSLTINTTSTEPFCVASASFTVSGTNNPGGNSAYGQDTSINPAFLQILVNSSFTRNDGTTAKVGEPLVKKRFGLNRLAWLTYKGPSATVYANNPSDPIILAMTGQGISTALIQQGTAPNILKYFGLTWGTFTTPNNTTSTTSCWVYNHGITGSSTKAIRLLTDVQAQNREPDFFELLKAAVTVGCLGKGAPTNHNLGTYGSYPATYADISQFDLDTNTDFQIFQIGANIISQFSSDSYPAHIQYVGFSQSEPTANRPWDFYGDENLPYLYRARMFGIVTTANAGTVTHVGSVSLTYGNNQALLMPEVWNPHDPNSNNNYSGTSYIGPGNFRFILAQGPTWTPGATAASTSYVMTQGKCRMYNNSGAYLGDSPYNLAYGQGLNSPAVQLDTDPPAGGLGEIDFSYANVNGAGTPQEPLFLGGLNAGTSCIGSVINYSPTKDVVTGLKYSGILLGTYPNAWLDYEASSNWSSGGITVTPGSTELPLQPQQGFSTANPASADIAVVYPSTSSAVLQGPNNPPIVVDYVLQYEDASSNWITYQDNTSCIPNPGASTTSQAGYDGNAPSNPFVGKIIISDSTGRWIQTLNTLSWMDPRTSRFGAFDAFHQDWYTSTFPDIPVTMSNLYYGESDRPTTNFGQGFSLAVPGSGMSSTSVSNTIGWYPGNWQETSYGANLFVPGYYAENITGAQTVGYPTGQGVSVANYFADPDGVVRRGMDAYATAGSSSTMGMPLSTYSSSNNQNRPFILNRPFRSVAELGYAFSGTPWRNIDFNTPESGYASLLDLFCVSETSDANAEVEGRVDLNTRQVPVLEALLSGTGSQGYAYKDELNAGQTGNTASLSSTEIASIAQALVNRTTTTTKSGEGPLRNLSELVGKWNSAATISGASSPFNIDGTKSYVGFTSDLVNNENDLTHAFSDTSTLSIQRLRESAIRALSSAGQTRVWNLMIDLIAQTGVYKPGETNLDNLVVDGEHRYWLHVAIDRFTGKVIDEQLEQVKD